MKLFKQAIFSFGMIGLAFLIACQEPFDGIEERTFEEQLEIDIEFIDIYLEDNGIEALEHSSGIRYVVEMEGEGEESPTTDSEVIVKYEGRFFSGVVFDSSERSDPLPLAQLIDSWKIMIPLMKVGGKMTVYAPSGYCYGREGIQDVIPPNASLIFDVELLEFEN